MSIGAVDPEIDPPLPGTEIDPLAAPTQPPPLAAPAPPVPPPAAGGLVGADQLSPIEADLLARNRALGESRINTAKKEAGLKLAEAGENADLDQRGSEQASRYARDLLDAVNTGDADIQAARDRHAEAVDQYSKARIHGYWEDKPRGARVLSRLAIMFGQLGADIGGGQNTALIQLNKEMDRHFDQEKERIGKLRDDVAMAKTGIADAVQAKHALLADVDAQAQANWKMIEQERRTRLAAKGATAAQIDADKIVQAAQEHQLDRERQALQPEITRVSAQIAAKARQKAKGAGGGVGGGYNTKIETRNLANLKELSSEAQKFAQDNDIPKLQHQYTELSEVVSKLKGGNPLTQATSLEQFAKSARGGAVTRQAWDIVKGHLGGFDSEVENWIEGKFTGRLGAQAAATFAGAVNDALGGVKESIEDKRKAFVDTYFTGARYNEKGNWEEQYNKLFGQFGYKAVNDPNAPTIVPGSGKLSTRTVGVNARAQQQAPAKEPAPEALPPGIPAGSTNTGRTSKGRPVYKAPDGTLHVPT